MAALRNMLSQASVSVAVTPSDTSYFSPASEGLDPLLFEGHRLRPAVREWVLRTVHSVLSERYLHPETWTRVWISGSGVSFQWAGLSQADVDVMLGVDYVEFRRANPAYASFSDSEVASEFNEVFYAEMQGPAGEFPFAADRQYDVTVYVNRGVSAQRDSISIINPYAAYDVSQDEWAQFPSRDVATINPAWEVSAERDRQYAEDLIREYGDALEAVRAAKNPAHRTNAVNRLHQVMDSAAGLYEELHAGRRAAFGHSGAGYSDFHNYRWQAGKRNGVVQAARRVRDYLQAAQSQAEFETYGMELPDSRTLVRRAMQNYGAVPR